jgi:hypothetical protein
MSQVQVSRTLKKIKQNIRENMWITYFFVYKISNHS